MGIGCGYAGYVPDYTVYANIDDNTEILPLNNILSRLRFGPPRISFLLDLIGDVEAIEGFMKLVREYLPEHEVDFEVMDSQEKYYTFIRLFSDQYFPLIEYPFDSSEALYNLITWMPADYLGYSYDEYHDFSYQNNDEFNLLLTLVTAPYDEDGARVPLLEAGAKIVGEKLINKIPSGGWTPERLRELVGGKQYDALADFADYIHQDTPCQQLNYTGDDGYAEYEWDHELVETLSDEWVQGKKIFDGIKKLQSWLEQDLRNNFKTLIGYLLARDKEVPKEEDKPSRLIEILNEEFGDD